MKHANTKQMRDKYIEFLATPYQSLRHCYTSYSYAKEQAFNYCIELCNKYNCKANYTIMGYNTMTFSFGFTGEINGKEAFFYITKSYDRFIYLDEIE